MAVNRVDTSDFRLLVPSALPGAAFERSAPVPENGFSGSPFRPGLSPMTMIFGDLSKSAPHLPHIEILTATNLVPIRRETKGALENRAIMRLCVWRHLRFSA